MMIMGINVPVILTIVLFFLVSFVVGVMGGKKASGGFMSFMNADRSLPTWMVFSATFATYAGTIVYMAWMGNVGVNGLRGAWAFFAHTAGFMMMGLFFVPILVRMKRVNFAEPLGERYDGKMQKISSLLMLIFTVGNSGNVILGIGMMISMYSNLSLNAACIISTAVMLLYVMIGGMYGVSSSSAFQGLIMIAFTIIAPIVVFITIGDGSMVGGFRTVMESIPDSSLSMKTTDWSQTLGLVLVMGFASFFRPDMAGTIYSAKKPRDGVVGWVCATCMAVLFMGIIIVIGLACKYAIPDYTGASDQYPAAMFSAITPVWLTVFYILCLMASAVSTGAALMMAIPRHYVSDFHLPLFYKNKTAPDDKKSILISRISMVVLSIVSLIWAIAWSDILTIFNFIFTMLVAGLLMPYIGMLIWPRMTSSAAKVSAITGAATAAIFKFGIQGRGILPGYLNVIDPAIPALLLAIVVAIVVTLLSEPEYEKVYKFGKVYNLKRLQKWGADGMEKMGLEYKEETIEETGYNAEKQSYEVEEAYTMPEPYMNGLWIWPTVCLYIILIFLSAPGEKLFTAVAGGAWVVAVFVIGRIIKKKWPM